MLEEFVIDEEGATSEINKQKKPANTATSWAGIFAQDVPDIYLQEGYEKDGEIDVPKLLPKSCHIREYYKEAHKLGLDFNVYAMAKTLKAERGPLDEGEASPRWQKYADQYKAIGSIILCRMLGYGSPGPDPVDDAVHVFGKDLYAQTTGLVKLVVTGQGPWGTGQFATKKEIDPEKDWFLIQVASKILDGTYFIGDKICGAVSFYTVSGKTDDGESIDVLKPAKIEQATKHLYSQTPYCGQDDPDKYPSKSMGKKNACWTGPVEGAGLAPTQIRMFAKLPLAATTLRAVPDKPYWCDRTAPRLPEAPGFDIARTKLKWLREDSAAQQSFKGSDALKPDSETVVIKPYKEYQKLKDLKGETIPSAKGFFVMDGNMINALRRVSNIDLAMTSSYVKLFHRDQASGKNKIINVHFLDNNLKYDEKNVGRPKAALMGVDISTQESSNTFITLKVDIRLKIFDKSVLDFPGGILAPFFYAEYPFGIEYGHIYNGPNEDVAVQKLLNWKDVKLCNPTSYDLTIDEKGIYEFVIHAVAGPEHALNKMYVGSFTMKGATDSEKQEFVDPYMAAVQKYEEIQKSMEDLEEQQGAEGPEYAYRGGQKIKVLKPTLNSLKAQETKWSKAAQEKLSEYIASRLSLLNEKLVENPHYSNTKIKGQSSKGKQKWVSAGDIIRTLCMTDLENALKMYSTGKEEGVALVWGRFNANCGDWANECMDKFLIPFDDFKKKLAEEADVMSQASIRLDYLLSKIISYYNDETAYRGDPQKEYEGFRRCDVVHYIEHTLRGQGDEAKEYIQYVIADKAYGIDFCQAVTQHFDPIEDNNGHTSDVTYPSVGERKQMLEDRQVAYIQMMDAGSFAKSIKFQAELDENIVNISLEKIMGYTTSSADLEHGTVASDKLESQKHTTKIRQILKGSLDLWGHPLWQPMRCFYMFADSQEHDGWYQIMNVHHSFSVGLPTTTIEVLFYLYS